MVTTTILRMLIVFPVHITVRTVLRLPFVWIVLPLCSERWLERCANVCPATTTMEDLQSVSVVLPFVSNAQIIPFVQTAMQLCKGHYREQIVFALESFMIISLRQPQ